MSEERIYGIDLGTTHSAIAVVDAGFPFLLADEEGHRIQPSVVAFDAGGDPSFIGRTAKGRQAVEPMRVVSSVKRFMGLRPDEINSDARIVKGEDGMASFRIEGKLWSPEQISAEILKELVRIAEWREEGVVRRVVITVPAYFNDAQRAATKRAGELAGLQVERIINEPTAAALAFGFDRLKDRTKVAVFDLGGGTFDLTILQLDAGVFEVLSTRGDTHLGGDDVDELLAREATRASGLEWESLTAEELWRLLGACEQAKRAMGDLGDFHLDLPFFRKDLNLSVFFSHAEVERLLSPLLDRIERHCRQAVLDSECVIEQLDRVILVGGSSRLACVRRRVEQIFGKTPDLSQDPDETIALGAAIQGAILSGGIRDIVLLDVTPLSLGLETVGGLMNVLIPRNTTIPCKAGELYTNASDGQTAMRIRVLQGEREMARDNWQLGELELPFEASPRGQARIGVQFAIDADGLLQVLARNVITGEDLLLEIDHAAVDVDDERVEQMVSESVEHAFEDMNERVFTEAKMKAEELLPAVFNALKVLADELSEAERQEIEKTAGEVQAALDGQVAARLKATVRDLDKKTEGLAARLVEKAMEDALARKMQS